MFVFQQENQISGLHSKNSYMFYFLGSAKFVFYFFFCYHSSAIKKEIFYLSQLTTKHLMPEILQINEVNLVKLNFTIVCLRKNTFES